MLTLHAGIVQTESRLTRQVFWFTFLPGMGIGGVVQLAKYELQSRPTRRHQYHATQVWDRVLPMALQYKDQKTADTARARIR